MRARRMPPAVRRLMTAYVCLALATALPWPLLMLLVWDESHRTGLVGLVGAARMAPYVLLSWAAGAIAQRVGASRVLLISSLLRPGLIGAAGLAVLGDHVGLAVAACTLCVAAGTPAYPIIGGVLPALGGRRTDTDVLVTAEVCAWVVGPALGGLLITRPHATVAAALGLAAIGAALVGTCVAPTSTATPPPSPHPSAAQGLLRTVWTTPALRIAVAVTVATNLVHTVVEVALVPLADARWGGADAFGPATAALGFGALLGPALSLTGRSSWGRIVTAFSLTGAALAIAAVGPFWVAAIALGSVGAALAQAECAATGVIQDVAVGRATAVLGLTDTAMVASALAGACLAPALLVAGPVAVLLGLGAASAGTAQRLRGRASATNAARPQPARVLAP